MRKITAIIIHCSATKENQDIDAEEIRRWHKNKGWSDIGYHYVIRRNGAIELGRPLARSGAHAKKHNKNSIGICMVGGVDANNRKKAEANFSFQQYTTLHKLVNTLRTDYPIKKVLGHNQIAAKACPCFDVPAFFSSKG